MVTAGTGHRDVFISHAREDKDGIARPLADELIRRELSVWFDEYELVLGDPLRQTIDDGLRESTIGVVILSHHFFAKSWPQQELDGLHARLTAGERNVIVPIWHELTESDLRRYSPLLAGLFAGRSTDGVPSLADAIERVLGRRARVDRRAAVSGGSTLPAALAQPVQVSEEPAAEPVPLARIADGLAVSPPAGAGALSERAVDAVVAHDGEGLVTIVAAGSLVVELAKRADGVISIRSNLLNPRQRVLEPRATEKAQELITSALSRLSASELSEAEVRSSPQAASSLPPALLASEDQRELAHALAAALRLGADPREIQLGEDRGSMVLRRSGEMVNASTSPFGGERARVTSSGLADADLADRLLACLTDVSTAKAFGGGWVEDRFPFPGPLGQPTLRALTEELAARKGVFAVWQERPVERPVLTARLSSRGVLILERPGLSPSVERYPIVSTGEFVESFEAAVEALGTRTDPLEIRADWLIARRLS